MARAHFVKKARKDIVRGDAVIVAKGESYYWWKFRYGPKQVSKNRPHRSQLTQSGFLSSLYSIEDEIEANLPADSDLQGAVENLISELESLRDECQSSLENMPEHLQESSTSGQLLTERIDALEGWISDLENVDFDVDADEDEEDGESVEDKFQELVSEIQGMNPGIS